MSTKDSFKSLMVRRLENKSSISSILKNYKDEIFGQRKKQLRIVPKTDPSPASSVSPPADVSPAPGIAATPSASPAPSSSATPSASSAPSVSEAPSVSPAPAIAQTPSVAASVGETQSAAVAKKAAVEQPPSAPTPNEKKIQQTLRRAFKQIGGLLDAIDQQGDSGFGEDSSSDVDRIRAAKRQLASQKKEINKLTSQVKAEKAERAKATKILTKITDLVDPALRASSTASAAVDYDALASRVLAQLELKIGYSAVTQYLAEGASVDDSIVRGVRNLIGLKKVVQARSVAYNLMRQPENEVLGQICFALCSYSQDIYEVCAQLLLKVDKAQVDRFALEEYLISLVHSGSDIAESELTAALSRLGATNADGMAKLRIAQASFGVGYRDIARQYLKTITDDERALIAKPHSDALRWIEEYFEKLDRQADRRSEVENAWNTDDACATFSVIDYKQGDYYKSSTNVGDFVQSIAGLGNIVRFKDVSFVGSDGLPEFAATLRSRLKAERQLTSESRTVRLVAVDRDASHDNDIPAGTWHIGFGWYMQPTYGGKFDFPLNPNLRPIFISFHVNNREMLDDAAVAYLKKYSPVGCRDWTTVYTLRSLGVPCFFSGCFTTTIDTVFGEGFGPVANDGPVCYVDARPTQGDSKTEVIEPLLQAFEWVRWTNVKDNLDYALQRMDEYRTKYSRVVTSRLHCYIPNRSIGNRVDFVPRNKSDVRFDGLMDVEGEKLESIRNGILSKLEVVVRAILDGNSEEEVYEKWRAICAPELLIADQYCDARDESAKPNLDIEGVCREALRTAVRYPAKTEDQRERIDIALSADENMKTYLPVTLLSITENTTEPVRVWILYRSFTADDINEIVVNCPNVEFVFINCDIIDYGPILGMLKHITVSTMDRLLLPELLKDVRRVVYIDIDTVVLGDIGELARMDLGGLALSAKSSILRSARRSYVNVYRASLRLEKELAWELRRLMNNRFPLDHISFNAGLLVMDLEMMRSDNFCENFIPYVERFGMNDQEVLNCYAGPNRKQLPAGWNMFPSQELFDDPKMIHWVGPVKPWHSHYVMHQESWEVYKSKWLARCAERGLKSVVDHDSEVLSAFASE